jgi:titin
LSDITSVHPNGIAIVCFLSPDVPSAPSNIRVTDQRMDGLTVEWTKPRTDGGSPITAYVVERREATTNYWTRVGATEALRTSLLVSGLRPGAEYYLRVFAENEMGVSEPCSTAAPIKLAAAAGKITIISLCVRKK